MGNVTSSIIITGAAGGVGVGLVQVFSAAGYRVVATDAVPLPRGIHAAAFVLADLARLTSELDEAARIIADLRRELAGCPLAALINNAAVQSLGVLDPANARPGLPPLSLEQWRETLAVNLLAPYALVREFLPELSQARGCVLNIGSIHSRLTKTGFTAYAASKAALASLTRSLAMELGGRVRVNALEPAAIETPMLRAGFADDPVGLVNLKAFHPSGDIGSPEELGRLARLVVEASEGFWNGAIIPFDGGISGVLHDPGNYPGTR